MMETIIGIKFKDFVLLAADKINTFSIIVVKNDMNKIYRLNDHLVMGVTGEPGDSIQFAEYISKNIQLYKMRNGYELSPSASATYVQRNLANHLRSRTPYSVNLMLAGYDIQTNKPHLYYIDYLATEVELPYGAHGYGAYFVTGLLDRIYKENCTLKEAKEIMKQCIAEIQKRLVINLSAFQLCVVDQSGIKHLDDVAVEPITIVEREETQIKIPMVH